MKKVYISADLEGLNGVTNFNQVKSANNKTYENTIKQLHCELKVIVNALLNCGIEHITINDAHDSMDNILISQISNKIELISGKPKPISMMNGLDSSFCCVFFVGYHAKAGTENGVLAHTFCQSLKSIKINDMPVGEAELNSIYAGRKNVPIAFATGDDVFCEQIKQDIGEITTVCTKKAISYNSAKCKPNELLFNELRQNVIKTINNPQNWILYKKNNPFSVKIDFYDQNKAFIANFLNCFNKLSATEIEFKSDNFEEIYKVLQFISATLY